MARARSLFCCTACSATSPKWAGRCPGCGEWNTLVADEPARSGRGVPVPLGEVDLAPWPARPTGIPELDRVLGGGLVPGSVTLLGGEPGIGKSTLLLQAMASLCRGGARALLVSAEESAPQVRLRAERLMALHPQLYVLAETDLTAGLRAAESLSPDVLVVDSVQALADAELTSAPGSVVQVTTCAAAIVQAAKAAGRATVLVGHVTKDGSLAGPRVLEHAVDTVLSFEGERHHALRMLRAVKHRFGATGELGLFEMAERGLEAVPDAGALFLADRHPTVPGSIVVPVVDGHRPLVVELQALVTPSTTHPRRSAQGLDAGRLGLVLAVLEARAGIKVTERDVFASVAGGVRVSEPGADLALALAVASAIGGTPVPSDLVACGEVGLAGEVRRVGRIEQRLGEAARLGFRRALVPSGTGQVDHRIHLLEVGTVADAVVALHLTSGDGLAGEGGRSRAA